MNWLNLTWFQRGSKNFWQNSNFGPRVKDDSQPPAYSAYRQFPQGGWRYGAKSQPAAAEGSPPPSEKFPQRPNLSTACNWRTRTERAQPATERATGTRPASAWLAHAQHGTRFPKKPIDTGNMAVFQIHLPKPIESGYLDSFGRFAWMLRIHIPLRKQHIQLLTQSAFLFMVNVQLIRLK